jgi:hypothetical protein
MSGTSFPRAQHIALLRRRIEERVRGRSPSFEVVERGLNHLKCQYKFGLRIEPEGPWRELAIHFQVAERLHAGASEEELGRIVDGFLDRHFAGHTSPADELKTRLD